MSTFLKQRLRNFREARRGNVAMMFAFGAPILMMGIAVAVDFSNASIVHTKLNAAADAAALAALTPAMMAETDAQAQAVAQSVFNARVDAIGSLISGDTTSTIVITEPNGPTSRQVVVTYSAKANTILGGVIGTASVTVQGTSTAQAKTPPNIDFYLLLDNSPSMALPATAAGITQMQSLTPTQDQSNGSGNSCAFACHQASTNNSDTMGNPCSDGSTPTVTYTYTYQDSNNHTVTVNVPNSLCATTDKHGNPTGLTQLDNFALARQNGIQLRLDELTSGISTLMSTANSFQNSGIYATPPAYRFAAYSMDSLWSIGVTNTRLMALTSDFINSWNSASANFGVMEMWANDQTCNSAACTGNGGTNDVATNYDNALSDMLNTLPTPGNGTNQAGDKPQEVLFFVTDGVEDESYGGRVIQTINGGGGAGVDYCAAIKATGVKIAILYTEYLAVTANAYYNANVAPLQSSIGPKLQACASSGLYVDAAIGADLGAALNQLFNLSIQQASLSK